MNCINDTQELCPYAPKKIKCKNTNFSKQKNKKSIKRPNWICNDGNMNSTLSIRRPNITCTKTRSDIIKGLIVLGES